MNLTEEKAIEEARKAMSDIDWDYDTSQKIEAGYSSKKDKIEQIESDSLKNNPNYIASLKSYWVVGFEFIKEAEIYNNSMSVKIDDETGEAYLLSHRDASFKIKKGDDGKYVIYESKTRGGEFTPV